jgi:hypothetical protein
VGVGVGVGSSAPAGSDARLNEPAVSTRASTPAKKRLTIRDMAKPPGTANNAG